MADMESKWESRFQKLIDDFNRSDQYSRLNSLLLHGYKNLPPYHGAQFIHFICHELNFLFPSLNGRILPMHIDDAHPLKTKRNGKSQVVIVKFVNRWIKDEIMKCKDDLFNTGLTLTEHLTANTLSLLSAAGKVVGPNNVWVFKTIVYAQSSGHISPIKCLADINKLNESVIANTPPVQEATRDNEINSNDSFLTPITPNEHRYPPNVNRPPQLVGVQPITTLLRGASSSNNSYSSSRGYRQFNAPRGFPSRNGRGRGFSRIPTPRRY